MSQVFSDNEYIIYIYFGVAIALTTLMMILTPKNELPNCPMIISLFTFAMSLTWIWFAAGILINLLQAIGLLLNIPDTFLGMTVLTYGNSIADLALNVSLVKNGYGEMAIAGTIAGPLFNLLVGLGSSLLKMNYLYGTLSVNFYNKENVISVVGVFVLIVNLILVFVQCCYSQYTLGYSISYVGFAVYGLFLLAICYITFFSALKE